MSEIESPIDVVNEQADDEGLWFVAELITESYLQASLRRLHAAVEAAPRGVSERKEFQTAIRHCTDNAIMVGDRDERIAELEADRDTLKSENENLKAAIKAHVRITTFLDGRLIQLHDNLEKLIAEDATSYGTMMVSRSKLKAMLEQTK